MGRSTPARYILALNASHNASACIGDETGIRYAIQEERLTRQKNFWGFPQQAIEACLAEVGATSDDLKAVVYGGQQVLIRHHTRDDVLRAYRRQATLTGRLRQRVAMPLVRALYSGYGQSTLRRCLADAGLDHVPLVHYDHHLSHAATAYYGLRTDPAEKYLVLTCDGSGDGLCATVRVMGGGEHELLATTPWTNSLGSLYSWTTFILGFVPLEHEYKLMGMAPYAADEVAQRMARLFRNYLWLDETGLAFQRKTVRRLNDVNEQLFRDLKGQRTDYVCAGLQCFTEELLTAWVKRAVAATGIRKVQAAGGVFMNVKANQRIAALDEVESFEAFPSCGDESLPLGAFYLEAAKQFGDEAVPPLSHYYLGEAEPEDAMEKALRRSGFTCERPERIDEAVAAILAQGHPVARCAGHMEFGARALGNRSILADPSNPDCVRVINQMVKKRDFWMPFAPIVLAEKQDEYLANPKGLRSPYMMMTFDTKPDTFREFIAAVHNADLTCRPQILHEKQNPDLYSLMKAFEAATGRGVLLNTSFNLHGYPIVRTTEDALHVFENSGLEYMQVGDWLVSKN